MSFEWVRSRIYARRNAARSLFLTDSGLPTEAGRIVLTDLARFCCANKSTAIYSHVRGVLDPYASARLDGRREVWLRLNEYLNLDERYLVNLRETQTDE